MDMEKVIKGLECCLTLDSRCGDCPYYSYEDIQELDCERNLLHDAIVLLKEQDELLRKLQKDKDKLCLEISEWKHKFNDAPPKFVSQGVVDQIYWERDTALSQLEQIGKGLGSKMDDIVALLKEQEAVEPLPQNSNGWVRTIKLWYCGACHSKISRRTSKYCPNCGRAVNWDA